MKASMKAKKSMKETVGIAPHLIYFYSFYKAIVDGQLFYFLRIVSTRYINAGKTTKLRTCARSEPVNHK
jgi:hypothetical protein